MTHGPDPHWLDAAMAAYEAAINKPIPGQVPAERILRDAVTEAVWAVLQRQPLAVTFTREERLEPFDPLNPAAIRVSSEPLIMNLELTGTEHTIVWECVSMRPITVRYR